jgi:hypothetical protein
MRADHFRQGMRGLSLRLSAALKASGPLGDALTKGEIREEEIVEAIRPHIPRRYEIVKGIVVAPNGAESDPQDIILVDSFTMPPIFGRGNNKAVPVESVVGTIQVKSVASKSEIRKAVGNIASAKRLLSDELRYGYPPAGSNDRHIQATSATFFGGIIILYKQPKSHNTTLAKNFVDAVLSVPARERTDALCLLDEFTTLWTNMDPKSASQPANLEFAFRAEQAQRPMYLESGTDSILFLYLSMAEHLNHWITPPISWLRYTRSPGFFYQIWEQEVDDSRPENNS